LLNDTVSNLDDMPIVKMIISEGKFGKHVEGSGRDSSVYIATRYWGLDGQGIEF
jgi:hypothetical protein